MKKIRYDIDLLIGVADAAANAIMEVYAASEKDWAVTSKNDNSPLTLADRRAHEIIADLLLKSYPNIPILSEEGRNIPYVERKAWEQYWCVDPLDGTKEFLARNGQFTVNIALIYKNRPILGVIGVPTTGVFYYGIVGEGAFRVENGQRFRLCTDAAPKDGIKAVGSRSHQSPEEAAFLEREGVTDLLTVGSSLKFCYVAEGRAQVYYRHGPTMEWDTAAGEAIVLASGGEIRTVQQEEMRYNKENLLNPGFICRA